MKRDRGKIKTFEKRIKAYYDQEAEIREKEHLEKTLIVGFRGKKKVPLLSRLALKVVRWQGGRIEEEFRDKNHGN